MRDEIYRTGIVPQAALTWHEEESRFAFQNGETAFMRNWPYAYSLMQDSSASRVAGRYAVAVMPAAPGGRPTATLGGAQLAINAHSDHPEAAWAVIDYLTRPEQMLERARGVGQYPTRPSLYDDPALAQALSIPAAQARDIIEHAVPRPVTPVYTQLSDILQIDLHRALTRQQEPAAALAHAAAADAGAAGPSGAGGGRVECGAVREGRVWQGERARASEVRLSSLASLGIDSSALAGSRTCDTGVAVPMIPHPSPNGAERREARLAWWLASPALATILLVALFPLLWTLWESVHLHDLRMPWLGRPFVGAANYLEALRDARFREALAHTLLFTVATVTIELGLGCLLALAMNRAFRGRALVRAAVLVPWAIPTVVSALLWRFIFEGRAGIANALLVGPRRGPGAAGLVHPTRASPGCRSCWPTSGRRRRSSPCCCWPACRTSTPRSTRRRASTARRRGASSATSRCRCSSRRSSWRSSSGPSTPSACST